MASRITTSYGPQAPQMNEKSVPKTSLDLTSTQCPRDKNP
jgi:hypothetical protein